MAAMAALGPLGALAGIAGAGIGAYGAMQQGAAAQAAGQYQYDASVRAGHQAVADSQINMINQQRKGDVMSGKFQAAAAGSGAPGGASVQALYGQMAAHNDTQAREALYQGQERQQADLISGQNAKYMGDVASAAAPWNAAGGALSGLSKVNWGSLKDFNFG